MARKGVGATSIQEITETADVGFGSFYNHFESKEAVVEAIVAETIGALANALEPLIESLEDPAEAAIVLANAQAYWDAFSLSERLGEAMHSRAVIEQAKGMLMAAQHCHEDTAFELLVRASQRENVKLREIARRIVDGATQRPDTTT